MDEQLIALYHRHVAAAFDRKLRLAAFVHEKAGKVKWRYDVATATLSCGPKLAFEAPLLGSHAHGNHSWLWAWANRNLKLTLTNRALGDLVRMTAHRVGVPMLAHPGFPLEPLLGPELTKHAAEVLGAILSHELGFDAYHVEREDDYDSAILVRNEKLKAAERYPLHRVQTVFPKVVAELPVPDHRAALAAYARDYGLSVTEIPHTLKITDGKGELTATFDEHDQLAKLDGTNVAVPPARKKVAKKPAAKTVAKKPAAAKAVKKPAPKAKAKPAAKVAVKKVAVKKVVAKKSAGPAPKAKASAKKPAGKKR